MGRRLTKLRERFLNDQELRKKIQRAKQENDGVVQIEHNGVKYTVRTNFIWETSLDEE